MPSSRPGASIRRGPTVLYAPTWTPHSSLNTIGEAVIAGLIDAGYTVLVKPHENSFDASYENSGGVDWAARLGALLQDGKGMLVRDGNVSPWLVAADVLVSDHSSVGFEYLLLDRPLVRIEIPELIRRAGVPRRVREPDGGGVDDGARGARGAPERRARPQPSRRGNPTSGSRSRPNCSTAPGVRRGRAVRELYQLMELSEPAVNRSTVQSSDARSSR